MRQAPQRVARFALLDTTAGAVLPEQTKGRMALIASGTLRQLVSVLAVREQ
jgi:hypothetical protein